MAQLQEIFKHLSSSYKTIEIRTLFLQGPIESPHILTKINFLPEPKEEEIYEERKLDSITLIKAYFKVDKWGELIECIKRGNLNILKRIIHLSPEGRGTDLDVQQCSLKAERHQTWPVFNLTYHLGSLSSNLQHNAEKAIKKLAYSNLPEFAEQELNFSKDYNSTYSVIEITLPVYARLENNLRITAEGVPTVTVTKRTEVAPLSLRVWYTSPENIATSKLYQIDPNIESLQIELPTIDLQSTLPIITLRLHHVGIGEQIHEKVESIEKLLIESGVNASPLYSIMSFFIPKEKFQKILTDSGSFSSFSVTPSDIFEEGVCKLLNLGGIQTIWLYKENEQLRGTTGNIRATVDAIGYHRESGNILVISCKMRISDGEKAIDNLKEATSLIEDQLPESIKRFIKITPIIFTSQMAQSHKVNAHKLGISVIDSNTIKELLDVVQVRTLNIDELKKSY